MKTFAATAVLAAAIAAAPAAAQAQADAAARPAAERAAEQDRRFDDVLARLRAAEDREAVRQLAYHYGRGNDELAAHFADPAAGRRRAAAEYARAFADDVRIAVYPLRSATPLREVVGVPDWIDFAAGFFEAARYSTTLHLMSNFAVELDGPDAARASAYAGVPHFIRNDAARDPATAGVALEYMIARYDYRARRAPDGTWRIVEFTIHLDEIARSDGFFPNGQQPGR